MFKARIHTLLILFAVILLSPIKTSAQSYDVSASIPFPAPTQSAVIDTSFDGLKKVTDVVEVFGTCQSSTPPNIVSIWRGGSLLGSVNCEQNGTFRLSISLTSGRNKLIARTSSISDNYGPDSVPTTITYEPPVTSVITDLVISSSKPYNILDENNSTSIVLKISGGRNPYTLFIKWGDGANESRIVQNSNPITLNHKYNEPGFYKIIATVTDLLGTTRPYQLIVSSSQLPLSQINTPTETTQDSKKDTTGFRISVKVLIWIVLFVFIILSSFFLGRWYEYRKLKDKLQKHKNQKAINPLNVIEKKVKKAEKFLITWPHILFILIVLAGIYGAVYLSRWSSKSVVGEISQIAQTNTDVKGSSSTLNDFETNLFITKVTSNFTPKSKNEVPSKSTLGQYLLADKNTKSSGQLAITVGLNNQNTVNNISPVQLRRTYPQDYEEVIPDIGFPEGSLVFEKKSEFEKAVFWVDQDRYVGVVVSGGLNKKAELENTLHVAVTNWQWR